MNSTSTVLFIFGGLVLVMSFGLKNSNFLDIRSIFIEHIKIFKGNPLQLISIFFVPLLFSIAIVKIRYVNEDILNNLNIILSILIAMFFAIMSILCAFIEKRNVKYEQLLKETFNAILFESIVCLMLLLVSFVILFVGKYDNLILLGIASCIIYYLTILAVLNMLVILKRIKVLFDNK